MVYISDIEKYGNIQVRFSTTNMGVKLTKESNKYVLSVRNYDCEVAITKDGDKVFNIVLIDVRYPGIIGKYQLTRDSLLNEWNISEFE